MIHKLATLFLSASLVACGAAPAGAPVAEITSPQASAVPTVAPSATIEPTPESTDTPQPTSTPEPTATTRPTPRTARVPTSTPVEATGGLGVTRSEIQFAYQEEPDNFAFEPVSESDGQPRLLGKSPDGLASVELTGGADDLTSIGLVISMPRDDDQATAATAGHIVRFCERTVPGWSDCGTWITSNLQAADLKHLETIQGSRTVTLTTANAGEQLTIIVLVEAAR